MDPFLRINSDLHELFLQHLEVIEILEYSTVSKRWHREIGDSKKCMSKLKLSMKFWKSTAKHEQVQEKVRTMENITRRYQHISVDCRFDRSVSSSFWKLLDYLAANLISLKVKSIKLDNPTSLSLPKLEELKLVYVPIDVRNILMVSSESFTKLKLKLVSPLNWNKTSKSDKQSLSCISKCLASNERLKEIELFGAVQYGIFFDEDLSKIIRFSLISLKIKNDMRLALIPENTEKNLIKFLSTQSSSLQAIYIDVCRPKVIQFIFNNLRNLKTIQIETVMSDFNVRDLNLQLNESVTDLRIPYISKTQDIREMLEMTPNVNHLFLAHISYEITEWIAWNLKKLRILKYRYDEIDCELFYETLRERHPDVNQEIEMIVDYDYT